MWTSIGLLSSGRQLMQAVRKSLLGRTIRAQHRVRFATVDAEVAFAVEEDYHRQGIASCLLGDLDRVGRSKGLVQFDADVLAVNWPMLAVFARSRLPMRQRHAQDVIHVTLSLDEGQS
jgi:GNAT superfamily N-acetyltransferase